MGCAGAIVARVTAEVESGWRGYARYVAIGDSQTEGLWDGDDTTGVVGFADRLADMLDDHRPGVAYANLAIRGRMVADVLNDQLPLALEMQPDLITVCAGMNDTTKPGRSFDRALADLDLLYRQLAASGATVVTTTFPDVTRLLPVGRLLGKRLARINDAIRTASATYGLALVDLYTAPSMLEPSTWSADRMHASTTGHILFARAAAEAIGMPGSSHAWAEATGTETISGFVARTRAQAQWTKNMFVPWAWRHARGRSAGDGRDPKHPRLVPVNTRCST